MKWPWSKEKEIPKPTEKKPRVWTEEELKLIDSLKSQRDEIQLEMNSWPKEKDVVKIKSNGRVGVVIQVFDAEPRQAVWSYHYDADDKLTNAERDLGHMKEWRARKSHCLRWDVRLKNGSIIGDLRYWEIEKVAKPKD